MSRTNKVHDAQLIIASVKFAGSKQAIKAMLKTIEPAMREGSVSIIGFDSSKCKSASDVKLCLTITELGKSE